MGKKRVLLALADPGDVEAFRRILGAEWEITVATSGTVALAEMKTQPFDVAVADLDLPELDGAELLSRLRKRHPKTIRFILAAEADKSRVLKHVLGAHQFLTKPFDPEGFKTSFKQAFVLDQWIGNDHMRELVSRVRSFPTLPAIYLEVLAALKSPDATTEQVSSILAKDMAMMTKLMQVLNSAYFGLPRRITEPAEAVGILGFDTVKSLVVSIKLLNLYDKLKPASFSIEQLWHHSTAVGHMAKQLVLMQTGDRALAASAFTAGLMHDLGKVVLAANFDEQYVGAHSLARKQRLPLWEVEKEIFGATHGEVGAYLFGLWGMPMDLLEAAAFHHCPSRDLSQEFTALTAVHVANAFTYETTPDPEDLVPPQIDEAYLAEIGLLACLPAWRQKLVPQDETQPDTAAPQPVEVVASEAITSEPLKPEKPLPSLIEPPEDRPAATVPVEVSPERARRARVSWLYPAAAAALVVSAGAIWHWKLRNEHPLLVQAAQNKDAAAATPGPEETAAAPTTPTVPEPAAPPTDLDAAQPPEKTAAPVPGDDPSAAETQPPSDSPSEPLLATNSPAGPVIITSPKDLGFSELKLQGIFFSSAHPTVIINGRLLRVKDHVAGAQVVEIGRSNVVLEYENQRKTLTLK